MTAETTWEKVIRWWIFTAAFSLIPLFGAYAFSCVKAKAWVPAYRAASHGELFLLAAAMCAGGLGELIGRSAANALAKITAGGAAVIIGVFSAFFFAMISSDSTLDAAILFEMAFWFFVFGLVASSCCIALSGGE